MVLLIQQACLLMWDIERPQRRSHPRHLKNFPRKLKVQEGLNCPLVHLLTSLLIPPSAIGTGESLLFMVNLHQLRRQQHPMILYLLSCQTLSIPCQHRSSSMESICHLSLLSLFNSSLQLSITFLLVEKTTSFN